MGARAVQYIAQAAVYTALLCLHQSGWLSDRSRIKVWEKSRRIGASWVEALYSVLEAAKKKSEGGQNTYYLSYNKDMTRQFIKDCVFWAKILNVVVGEVEEVVTDYDKDVTFFRIRFASGNEIEALPSESRSLRSKQGRVVIDEAAFVDDLPDLLKAAMALLMWGGQVVILSTHNGADNPFNELLSDIRAGKFPYSLHRTDLDDALEGGLYKAICRKSGQKWTQAGQDEWRQSTIDEYGDGADEELFCIPSQSTGVYLTSAMIEACMSGDIPVFRWQPPADDFVDWPEARATLHTLKWLHENLKPRLDLLPAGLNHFLGGDFGRTGDLTRFDPATECVDLSLALPFAVELRNCPHRTQEQILCYIIDHLPQFSGAALDARGNGSYLAEAARQKYGPAFVAEVMISENWYRVTMPKLKAHIEDKTLLLPLDAHTLADLRSLKVIRGVARIPDKRGKDATGNRHGDAVVSLGMLIHAREELGGVEPWECETAGEWASATMLQNYS